MGEHPPRAARRVWAGVAPSPHEEGGPRGGLLAAPSRTVVADPAFISVIAGAVYLTAGVLGLLTPLFPQAPEVQEGRLQCLAGAAALLGAGVLLAGGRLPRWSAHALVLLGTAAVSEAVCLAGATSTGVALASFYILIGLDVGLFFTRGAGWAQLVLAVAACTTVLARLDATAAGAGVIISATAVVVARGTGWMTRMAASADVDALTGLANRRRLDEVLTTALVSAERSGAPLSVCLLDLDHFKGVNDTQGHAAGDRLLEDVARAWTAALLPGQLLARQGGDEFALVLPGTAGPQALEVAERLRTAMPAGHTCSVGVAERAPAESISTLMRRADLALYQAKGSGRDGSALHPVPVGRLAAPSPA
jgi:diguanylate cyclase (GGDEF)-like protein